MNTPFPVIGLTGGIASGKSFLARQLASRGWAVLDADQVARQVVQPGSEGLAALVNAFGGDLLDPEGSLDRKRLGARVFGDKAARERLEGLLHPRIEARIFAEVEALPPDSPGAVLEAALWVERSLAHHFDELWVVEAPEALRLARLQARDGLGEAEARARLRAQSHPAEKRLHAQRVFLADGRDLGPELDQGLADLGARWKALRRGKRPESGELPLSLESMGTLLADLLGPDGHRAELFLEAWRGHQGREGQSARIRRFRGSQIQEAIQDSFDREALEAAAVRLGGATLASGSPVPPLAPRSIPSPNPCDRAGQGPRQRVWVAWTEVQPDGRRESGLVWDLRSLEAQELSPAPRRSPGTGAPLPVRFELLPVILSGPAAGRLIHETLVWMAGRSLPRGTRVASEVLTVIEDGTLPGFPGSAAIEDSGRPTRRRVLIDQGLLEAPWSEDPASPRSPGRNLVVLPGGADPASMSERIESGLRVVSLEAISFDPLQGTFLFDLGRACRIVKGQDHGAPVSGQLRGRVEDLLGTLEVASDFIRFQFHQEGRRVSGASPTLFCPALKVGWA